MAGEKLAMDANEVRSRFIQFFEQRGHKAIGSSSLLPENDPTVLFTTAGMHPLVPYLLGESHPHGKRLVNFQKCVRTGDIEEVGDNRHLTLFEMLGNWSLGDYWKEEAISWSWEFLTSPQCLGLDKSRLYVTVFEGDSDAPQDEESISIWKNVLEKSGLDSEIGKRIFLYPKKNNWWGPAGKTGPCGPDTEMFFDTLNYKDKKKHKVEWDGECHPNCDCGRYVEIWNDVFMQYFKEEDGSFRPLDQKNVDTGMGLERVLAVLKGKENVYDTDLFIPIIHEIEKKSGKSYTDNGEEMRIIADHIKAAVFIMSDGVLPSNVEQGYVLRRLLRRCVRYGKMLDIQDNYLSQLSGVVVSIYGDAYPEIQKSQNQINAAITQEEEKFRKLLQGGLKTIRKKVSQIRRLTSLEEFSDKDKESISVLLNNADDFISGKKPNPIIKTKFAFDMFQSHGFPLELTVEILKSEGISVDEDEFNKMFEEHQSKSRKGSEKKFSGGLADHSERVIRMHTATHLLHKSLRNVLGDHVFQKGSNITQDRLRFDFSHPQKMTAEEISKVEEMVNEQIQKDYPISYKMLSVDDAKKEGAIGLFEDKYAQMGDKVKVYFIGNDERGYFSKEICGGPHVEHTSLVGKFRIKKEESVSAGVRRIKAVVE